MGATFECSLDTAAYEACTSPKSLSGLADGPHTFRVRAKDALGNADASPDTRTFNVDSAAPTATITSGPNGWLRSTSATFEFTGETGGTLECKLDTGEWATCTSPKAYTGLGQGAHTFSARAKDAAGNIGPATSRSFNVDTIAPATTVTSGPNGPQASTSASFGFSSEAGATFQCNRDNGGWQTCTSPETYAGLSQGAHTFEVRATDLAGNTGSAASRSYSVDTVGPAASITAGPAQDSTITTSATSFSFTGEAGGSFDCKLDGGAWAPCTSPNTVSGLGDGSHTFRVRAKDALGNAGSEAARTFTVDTPAPVTPPATPAQPQSPAREQPETPSDTKPKSKPKASYSWTVMSTRGLEAMFGLGDSGRTAADAKGGQAGRFHGSPRRVKGLTTTGRDRSAHAFDGHDDRVDLDPDSLGRPRAFSIELWLDAARTHRTAYLLTAAADRALTASRWPWTPRGARC